MPHDSALIATIAAGIGVAFGLGLVAARLGLPPLVGYLVAGIVVGPFTPWYVADSGLVGQLAEFGVVLLMFGVGLHFSFRDLNAVRGIVIPGALAQTTITASVGALLAHTWGWSWGSAVVLGLSLGVASTAVLLKALEARDRLDSPEGRLAVGWLVVEDVSMVLALVLLPAVGPILNGGAASTGGTKTLMLAVVVALAKVAGFVALMFFVGRRFVPWLLDKVARLGSRELFTLAVLVTALGIGTVAAELFGVSFALGAFFAGAVISESELSRRAAADALPMQDAFAVLFFVSVGMLFDPTVLTKYPLQLLAIVAVVVLWKGIASYGLIRLLGGSKRAAVIVGASLCQIGEFSFIVAALGLSLGLVTRDAQALIVAAALIAITLNGTVISFAVRTLRGPKVSEKVDEDPFDCSAFSDHVILVGFGRVGATVAEALTRAGVPYVIVEELERTVGGLRSRQEHAVLGDATRADVLERAGVAHARLVVVTAPEPIRARRIVELARVANPRVAIAVRTHSAVEQAFFEDYLNNSLSVGGMAVYAEREAALSLAHYSLMVLGRSDDEADWVISSIRGRPTAPTETFRSLPTQEIQTYLRPKSPAVSSSSGETGH